jgi:hypothetical protein
MIRDALLDSGGDVESAVAFVFQMMSIAEDNAGLFLFF